MATKSKTLANLGLTTARASQLEIQGLAVDSRDVRQGFLFAALPGSRSHGAEFAPYALRQGARAILNRSGRGSADLENLSRSRGGDLRCR